MTYVNKSTKNIKSFLFLELALLVSIFNSMLPASLGFKLFIIIPRLLIKPLIPLLADLAIKTLLSMALKMLRVLNTTAIWQNKPSIEVFLFQRGVRGINPQNLFIYELTIHRPTMSSLELGLKM